MVGVEKEEKEKKRKKKRLDRRASAPLLCVSQLVRASAAWGVSFPFLRMRSARDISLGCFCRLKRIETGLGARAFELERVGHWKKQTAAVRGGSLSSMLFANSPSSCPLRAKSLRFLPAGGVGPRSCTRGSGRRCAEAVLALAARERRIC